MDTNDIGLPVYAAGLFPDGTYGVSADEDGLCMHYHAPIYCSECKKNWET